MEASLGERKVMVGARTTMKKTRGGRDVTNLYLLPQGKLWRAHCNMVAVSACSPHVHRFHRSVTSNSMKYSASIFNNEKLKPGIYKIQNIVSQTYVDIREHTKELCCRPVTLLDGKGLVGSRPHFTHKFVAVMAIFSGKYTLQLLGTQYEGYGVGLRSRSPRTERGTAVRAGQP